MNDPQFIKRVDEIIASKNLGIKRIGLLRGRRAQHLQPRRARSPAPDDLRGVKIRVQNNPVEVKVWKAFGAIPTPMNFGEVYQALQSGVLDAAENGLAVIESNKHYEAAKSISQTEHQRNSLRSSSTRRSSRACRPTCRSRRWTRRPRPRSTNARWTPSWSRHAADRLKSKGGHLTAPDKAKFIALIAPIQDEVASELKTTDVLQIIRSHAK